MTQTEPRKEAVTCDVICCARCGMDHKQITFKPITRNVDGLCGDGVGMTHWVLCPTNGEPLLMGIFDPVQNVAIHKLREDRKGLVELFRMHADACTNDGRAAMTEAAVVTFMEQREKIIKQLTWMSMAWGLTPGEIAELDGGNPPPTFVAKLEELKEVSRNGDVIGEASLLELEAVYEEELSRLRNKLVWEFNENNVPEFSQGTESSCDLLTLVTAERCRELVKLAAEARAELNQVDASLARRAAFDGCKTRADKIELMCSENQRLMANQKE